MILDWVVYAAIQAGPVALVAIALIAYYRVGKVLHVGFIVHVTAAPYISIFLFEAFRWPILFCAIAGCLLSSATAIASEEWLFSKLRRRGASGLNTFVASLGFWIAGQGLIALAFGSSAKSIGQGGDIIRLIGAVNVTDIQLLQFLLSWALLGGLLILWHGTRFGTVMRAIASDYELSVAYGLPVVRTISLTIIGSSMACSLAGVLVGYETIVHLNLGFELFLLGLAAAFVGGFHDLRSTAVGAIVVCLLFQIAGGLLPGRWQLAVVFLLVIVSLILRRGSYVAGRYQGTRG